MSEELKKLRDQIDETDAKILELLEARSGLARQVGDVKKQDVSVVYDPAREKRVVDRLVELSTGDFPVGSISDVWREIVAACRSVEKPLVIGYLGPEATFTHEAAIKRFGSANRFEKRINIHEVLDMVERGICDYAVVPVENSLHGVVATTLDYFIDSPLKICGEIYLPIEHNLLSCAESIDQIKVVYSHPQAFFQCHNWLGHHLPGVVRKEVESTARAAEIVAEQPDSAAIASRRAASLYCLRVLAPRVEDNRNNTTRFIVAGKKELFEQSSSRTTVLFSLKDRAGALYHALKPFSEKEVNLTKIESRPSRRGNWDYIFFADIDGHINEGRISETLAEVEHSCNFLKVLGSYPKDKSGEN